MKLALLLLLAASLSYADVLQQAVQEYLEPGMVITNAVQMPLQNGSFAYIIPIDGQETLMIGSWSPKAIENEDAILAILQDGLKKQANSAGAKIELKSVVAQTRAAKQAPEAQCALYTGTENQPCVDRDTCNVAAQSSPQAQIMVQADGFWQNMRDWYVKKEEINTLLSELSAMANSPAESQQFAVDVSLKIRAAYTKMQELDANDLMRPGVYGIDRYCPQVVWPYQDLLKSEGRWKGIGTTLSSLSTLDSRAHNILLRTRAWLDYVNTRASEFLRMERGMDGRLLSISQRLGAWNRTFADDVGLNSKYASLDAAAKNAAFAGNAGRYRAALSAEDTLIVKADEINARIDSDFKLLNLTGMRLANARKAAGTLKNMGRSAQSDSALAAVQLVEGQLAGKPKATALDGLSSQAKQAESSALEAVAAAMIGIERENETVVQNPPPIPRNTTAPAQPPAQAGQNSTMPPIPQVPPCPLPFAVAGAAMWVSLAYARRGKMNG